MARYIDADAFLEKMKKTSRYFDVKFDIEEMPTADVVPIDVHEALNQRAVEEAKAEVAREIFEEIEKCFRENLPYTTISKFYLVELKKKYGVGGQSGTPVPTGDNEGGGFDEG